MRSKARSLAFSLVLMCLLSLFTISVNVVSAETQGEVQSVKGRVKSFANPAQAKTISLEVEGKGTIVFNYDDKTAFKNFQSLLELQGETASIEYKSVGSDNLATVITKAFAKIPEGVQEITTEELAALIEKGPESANYFLADSRPAGRYAEGHIPTAHSVPLTALEEKGAELLPQDKNTNLIFYCGGPT